jgi:hypothetical protein
MSIKNLSAAVLALSFGALALNAVADEQWHFVVKNTTSSNITNLQVSQDKQQWGNFDIGSGIGPGERATLVWAAETNDQNCQQWIRAKFADGSTSGASKQDFCHDLDDPIEFGE